MRKTLLCILLACLCPLPAPADERVTDGRLHYILDMEKHTATVDRCDERAKKAVIPASIDYGGVSYSVTGIRNYAFQDCRKIKSITIPKSVTSIEKYAISLCPKLKSITIPEGVTNIEDGAFWQDRGLKAVTLPEGVTSIGKYAFSKCAGLKTITIPESVTNIGLFAFALCSGLTEVRSLNPTPPSCGQRPFNGKDGTTLYVPIGAAEAYRNAEGWKEFKNIVEETANRQPGTPAGTARY